MLTSKRPIVGWRTQIIPSIEGSSSDITRSCPLVDAGAEVISLHALLDVRIASSPVFISVCLLYLGI